MLLNLCLISAVHGQQEPLTADQVLFDQAVRRFEDEDYAGAAEDFRQFMTRFPQSQLLARSHYNLALTYDRMNDFETSKKLFLEILEQPYNERDENGLMEPYTQYKHHSCRHLAAIALRENDYKSAEKYIHLFDKKYPYQHFCGNEWSAYDMFKAVMKARVYEGTDEVRKAMEELLPFIFSDALASNDDVLDELSGILERNYTRDSIQQEFKSALMSLEVKETKKNTSVTILLYGVTIQVQDFFFEQAADVSGKEHYQKIVEENALFKKFL